MVKFCSLAAGVSSPLDNVQPTATRRKQLEATLVDDQAGQSFHVPPEGEEMSGAKELGEWWFERKRVLLEAVETPFISYPLLPQVNEYEWRVATIPQRDICKISSDQCQ